MDHAPSNDDHILAAFIEPGSLPDVATRVNMSLAALARWTNANLDLLEGVHKALVTRCKLIAAHLELSALTALAAVSCATTQTDDPKLRERALERQRKAANAILRHKPGGTAVPARTAPHARGKGVPPASSSPTSSNAQRRMPNAASLPSASSLDASMPPASMPSCIRPPSPRSAGRSTPSTAKGDEGTCIAPHTSKHSLAERLAARRLATLNTA